MQQIDFVIRNGLIADGLGSPLFRADIAIRDGMICEIGSVTAFGVDELDASGMIVTPGFVDVHTHYDGQACWDSRLQPSSASGVTTVVMGNCGVGFAPVRPHHRDLLVELMEGVEDIPGAALHEGLDWQWESFGDFLTMLERRPRDIDVCAQLPHGPLRVYVMGERAAAREAATPNDIARMRELTAEAIRAGAIGFSTSRSIGHRTSKGDPTPMLRAAEDELMGIAMGMADAGRGVFQLVSDFDTPGPDEEFDMLVRIARQSGRPISISVIQRHDVPEKWRWLLARVSEACDAGLQFTAQVAPRPVGVLQSLQGSRNPFVFCASYEPLQRLPLEERVQRMRDPRLKAQLLQELEDLPDTPAIAKCTDFSNIFLLGDPANYSPHPDDSIEAMAKRSGRSAAELAYDSLLQNEGRSFLLTPFGNYAYGSLEVCREMIEHPATVIGLGDGGAHVSIVADSSFQTFLLSHWGRDAEHPFDVSWLVKRQTSDTARIVGLVDRGVVAPGMKADLNVIDLEKLSLRPPYMKADLPTGGQRLLQEADGFVATMVSGQITYLGGKPTAALPGKLVRGRD